MHKLLWCLSDDDYIYLLNLFSLCFLSICYVYSMMFAVQYNIIFFSVVGRDLKFILVCDFC